MYIVILNQNIGNIYLKDINEMNLKIQIKVTNGDKIKKYMYHPKLITNLLAFR